MMKKKLHWAEKFWVFTREIKETDKTVLQSKLTKA